MNELDVPVVGAIERAGYQFPWSDGIFRDCLRVGYVCRVVEVNGDMAGYGIMSVGAGEAHVLNICIRDEYRCRGLARKMLLYLLERARIAGMYEAFLEVRRTPPRPACIIRSGSSRSASAAVTIRRRWGVRMRRSCAGFYTPSPNRRKKNNRRSCRRMTVGRAFAGSPVLRAAGAARAQSLT
jgi:GNAT superfamily N-acetyltransferase